MDAVKFLIERNRMLTSGFATPIIGGKIENEEHAKQIVHTVETWSEEHPRKTRQNVFLQYYQNALTNEEDGVLAILPCCLDRTLQKKCGGASCNSCRREYWRQEAE